MLFTKTPGLAYMVWHMFMAVDAAGHPITLKILGLLPSVKLQKKKKENPRSFHLF